MAKSLLAVLLLFFSAAADAQMSRYIVQLKDKAFNTYNIANPSQFLTQRAIDRRARYNIAIDSLDLPVTGRYIDSIRLSGNVTILNTSKWLNQVAIRTTDAAALAKINAFPFVAGATAVASFTGNNHPPVNKQLDVSPFADAGSGGGFPESLTDVYSYGSSNGQVKIHNGNFLHNLGFRGQGMQLAMMDAGFYHYLSLPTFDSMRNNNQVLGTWDFVANESSVDEDYFHGMQCLSTIAANIPGTFVGTAPKTSFYLYRTEDVASEYPIEEQNWAAAAERADSLGVDITSTSLGYFDFDNPSLSYTYANMDGNTSISARAADIASKKGMLNIVAAGNEGTSSWHYLITPSDADSVLAVGAVDTLGNVAGFSSYGPSSDGQVKPAVAAVGWRAAVASTANGMPVFGNGTSFACPNMAGIATCLWQAFPEANNMAIIDALQKSSHNYNSPNNRVGYGIPDVKKAFAILSKTLYRQQGFITNCEAALQLSVKTGNKISIVTERKLSGESNYSVIDSLVQTGDFALRNLNITDDLQGQPEGTAWYRIKMSVEADTSFYLDSLSLSVPNCISTAAGISIGPNPVQSELSVKVKLENAGTVQVSVYSISGQRVYHLSNRQAANLQFNYKIPFSAFSEGLYVVAVYADGKKLISRKVTRRN